MEKKSNFGESKDRNGNPGQILKKNVNLPNYSSFLKLILKSHCAYESASVRR